MISMMGLLRSRHLWQSRASGVGRSRISGVDRFSRRPSEYDVYGIDAFYDLRYRLIAGGLFNNCPTGGLGCVKIPPPVPQPMIPVTLDDGTTVSL